MPRLRVHFVELNARLNTLATKPVFPKYGTPLLATLLARRGHPVRIFLEGVSEMDFSRLADCDVVCMPVYAPAYNKVKAMALRLRRAGVPVIMGGPHVCLYPETVLELCDYAVRCEGDEALPELLDCLEAGGDPRGVAGISFRLGGRVIHTPEREPPAIPEVIPDLELIEGFAAAARGIGRRQKVVNALQTSRGCSFRCRFCPTSKLFGGVYRNRSIDSIVAEIRARLAYNPFFFVVDNSFLSNRERTVQLLRRLEREQLGAHLIIFERHEIARDTELLRLMRRAGVRCIIVGIESLSDENLRHYRKEQSSRQVRRSVEQILRHDLHVIGTFVVGGDGDTPAVGDQIVDFVRETGISPNLFVMHDVEEDPGKRLLIPLERRFRTHYLRSDPHSTSHYDYATGNFVSYFPLRMRPSTLQRVVVDIYRRCFSHPRTLRRVLSKNAFAAAFGVDHGFTMRRLTEVIAQVSEEHYLEHLRCIERGLYDGEQLVPERLAGLDGLPPPRPLEDRVDQRRYNGLIVALALPGLLRLRRGRKRERGGGGSLAEPASC